jgi:hypothetical protein
MIANRYQGALLGVLSHYLQAVDSAAAQSLYLCLSALYGGKALLPFPNIRLLPF